MNLFMVLNGVCLGRGGLVVLGGMGRFSLVIGLESGENCNTIHNGRDAPWELVQDGEIKIGRIGIWS